MKKKANDSSSQKRWISCPVEDEYFGHQRKEAKAERKLASAKDRSKYKKTDKQKFHKSVQKELDSKISNQEFLQGRVISIISQGIIVAFEDRRVLCTLRGLLKKDVTQAKNLVTVGDFVLFEKISEEEGVIARILPRKSMLSRADNLSRRKEQLIASNIDQVLITISVVTPPLKPPLIDRYIIAAQKGGMDPIIIINKIDLLNKKNCDDDSLLIDQEEDLFKECLKAYKAAGIPIIAISAYSKNGLDLLQNVMKDKVSVFSGPSGVGKSSLINAMTGLNLRVSETVEKTKKGAHTTTTAQLIPLSFGGWCIDTPGIKSFGVWNLKKEEIESYFLEIHDAGCVCKFPNCTHMHETDCAVQEAVENGEISSIRYFSYLALMESVSTEHRRR